MTTPLLQAFVDDVHQLLVEGWSEPQLVRKSSRLLASLLDDPALLDGGYDRVIDPHTTRNLMYCHPEDGFVVVAVVWAPGYCSPVHDHRVWGVSGVYRGRLRTTNYDRLDDGRAAGVARIRESIEFTTPRGGVSFVLPPFEEIHKVENFTAEPAISIHLYGRNVVECSIFEPDAQTVGTLGMHYDLVAPQARAVVA